MADSSAVLAAARQAQTTKKVMKGPSIDLDVDKLIAGVMGEGEEKKDDKKEEEYDDGLKAKGDKGMDAATHHRAAVRENTVDQLLSEYAAHPQAKIKVKKKVSKRYPCYDCRKVFGCAHVDLHTAVLEGNLGPIRKTLRRLGKKVSAACPHPLRVRAH